MQQGSYCFNAEIQKIILLKKTLNKNINMLTDLVDFISNFHQKTDFKYALFFFIFSKLELVSPTVCRILRGILLILFSLVPQKPWKDYI